MKLICPYCQDLKPQSIASRTVFFHGRFRRKSDGQRISRFWCKPCRRSFSSSTLHRCFRQKKRHKNEIIRRLLAGGMSQREIARVLRLNRKTVVRKFLFLATEAEMLLHKRNLRHPRSVEVEFDDLETFEHTKCKPLSVALMVEHGTRRILGFEVSKMPAKGKLAVIARKKYGIRKDERGIGRQRLFERMQDLVKPDVLLRSDSNPHYPQDVRKCFPRARHETILGTRGAITGHGELKKIKFDPLFSLNHTCAMLRDHVNRLIRRTWATTKKPERLRSHLFIYALVHNERLRPPTTI